MNNELTIRQVKELKVALEKEIQEAIKKFSDDTGVLVKDVEYAYADMERFDGISHRASNVRVITEV